MFREDAIQSMLFSTNEEPLKKRLLFLMAVLVTALVAGLHSKTPESLRDFFGYYLAASTFYGGGNPYSLSALEVWKTAFNYQGNESLIVWNPPFTLMLFLPALGLSASVGFAALTGLNLVAVAAVLRLCWPPEARMQPRLPTAILLSGLFAPLWFIFSLGQITLLLLCCAVAAWHYFRRGHFVVAGILASLLAIKIHLFFLFALCLGIASLQERRPAFLISAALSLSALCGITELLHPHIHSQWMTAELWPPKLLGNSVVPLLWKALSPGGNVETLRLLSFAIPLLGAALMTVLCIRRGALWCSSSRGLATALLLTPLFTSYGFIFDHVILLPVLIWLLADVSEQSPRQVKLFFSLMLVAALGVSATSSIQVGPVSIFWYIPYVEVAACWLLFCRPLVQD